MNNKFEEFLSYLAAFFVYMLSKLMNLCEMIAVFTLSALAIMFTPILALLFWVVCIFGGILLLIAGITLVLDYPVFLEFVGNVSTGLKYLWLAIKIEVLPHFFSAISYIAHHPLLALYVSIVLAWVVKELLEDIAIEIKEKQQEIISWRMKKQSRQQQTQQQSKKQQDTDDEADEGWASFLKAPYTVWYPPKDKEKKK
ncbi:hypothetical protein SAMN02746089_01913 [Caldanaerobius fijiensis DSM 17918]|uniref:Uncharacterized protein n=1 Tax=Caldanaerobius fijiensis DSM 17918 TaxID=1121256 RepID=A0A1M5BMC3_9THEO|nr:hypothetical protein [Caldanaerobius fijiensis]SHF43546.1 hypothetical protein SAMN02746089_01913 [Caldanaerobius fijiensis DSM 17918]